MKYFFSFLLIVLLAACGSPAGRAVKKMSSVVNQCCVNLPFSKTSAPLRVISGEPAAGRIAVAIFEPEMQLIHTW